MGSFLIQTQEKRTHFGSRKGTPFWGPKCVFFFGPQGARRSNSSAGMSTRAGSRLHSLLHVFTATCQPPTCLAPRHLFRAEPLGCLRGATPLPLAGLLSLHQRRRARLCCRPCWTGWAPQQQGAALAPARVAPTRQWQPRVSATTTRSWGCVGPARTCPGAGGNASPALGPPRISAPPTWVLTPLCHVGQKMVHGCVGQLEAGTRLRTCTHHDLSNVFNEWGRGKDRDAPATRTPNIS